MYGTERHQQADVNSGNHFVLGLLWGAAIGTAIGVLVAPRTADLRHQLVDSAGRLRRRTTDAYGRASDAANRAIERGREAVRQGRDAMRDATRRTEDAARHARDQTAAAADDVRVRVETSIPSGY